MTSFATILGILPIALALGAGAESRKSMGIAVIGGLLVGTLLTLYVVPAMYSFLTSRVRQTLLVVEEGGGRRRACRRPRRPAAEAAFGSSTGCAGVPPALRSTR